MGCSSKNINFFLVESNAAGLVKLDSSLYISSSADTFDDTSGACCKLSRLTISADSSSSIKTSVLFEKLSASVGLVLLVQLFLL